MPDGTLDKRCGECLRARRRYWSTLAPHQNSKHEQSKQPTNHVIIPRPNPVREGTALDYLWSNGRQVVTNGYRHQQANRICFKRVLGILCKTTTDTPIICLQHSNIEKTLTLAHLVGNDEHRLTILQCSALQVFLQDTNSRNNSRNIDCFCTRIQATKHSYSFQSRALEVHTIVLTCGQVFHGITAVICNKEHNLHGQQRNERYRLRPTLLIPQPHTFSSLTGL